MRLVRTLPLLLLSLTFVGCPGDAPAGSAPTAPKAKRSPTPKASVAAQGSSSKPQDLGPPPPSTIEAAAVQVGSRYRFKTQQGKLTIHETWTVTGVEAGQEVRYDLRSVTAVEGADPVESGPTPKSLQLSFEDAPPPPGPPPQAVGTETIEVSGQSFECTIYEQGDTRRWICPRFPRLIQVEQGGQPFKRLLEILPPE